MTEWLVTFLPIVPGAETTEYGNGGLLYGVPTHEIVSAENRYDARRKVKDRMSGRRTEYSVMVERLGGITREGEM